MSDHNRHHQRHRDEPPRIMKVARYVLLSCPSIEEFNARAQEMIEDGLQPYGKVHILMQTDNGVRKHLFSQAFAEYKV